MAMQGKNLVDEAIDRQLGLNCNRGGHGITYSRWFARASDHAGCGAEQKQAHQHGPHSHKVCAKARS